ncbi:dUTP diphosphatase [Niallia sp. 01092]|uniref:dUTP diphosphatase n=1 Tax=unclassified Niallia TaxID=2837522 RepID=UPI003FD4AAE5
MNLSKLFETQKILRERINYQGEDRFEKLILALLVELGECANEWRGFKFWSKDQKPRTKILCLTCHGIGEVYQPIDGIYINCPHCDGEGIEEPKNPLLEEYVDGLHFVLELMIEQGVKKIVYHGRQLEDVNNQFLNIYYLVSEFENIRTEQNLIILVQYFLGLGNMLGFTWEQIEQAYFEKNQVNHERQANGY